MTLSLYDKTKLEKYFKLKELGIYIELWLGKDYVENGLIDILRQLKEGVFAYDILIGGKEKIDQSTFKKSYLREVYKKQIEEENKKMLERRKELEMPTAPTIQFFVANYVQNVEALHEKQPFFYDKTGQFWIWDTEKKKYGEIDEIDLMNVLDSAYSSVAMTLNSSTKNQYLEAFKRIGRQNIPLDLDKNFIQFKSYLYDLKTGETTPITPKHFLTNPIEWDLGETEDCPTIDKLFSEWVGGEKKQILYEIAAYCLYRGYPIHTIFALVGAGRNGKTQYQKFLLKFLGKENVSSTDLDILLENRFESIKLFKKLAVQMGETNFGVMKKTSLLKKLSGGDLIGYERKNQKPFDDYNYAKILINSNSLPSSYDTSEGFYRRWLIVDFPNSFEEGKEVYETIPDNEYNNFAKKTISILKSLLSEGSFKQQGTIEERKTKYIQHSNPFGLFLESHFDRDPNGFVSYGKIFIMYRAYLSKEKKRLVSWKELHNSLADEGLEIRKTSKKIGDDFIQDRWIEGINEKIVPVVPIVPAFPLYPPHTRSELEITAQKAQWAQNQDVLITEEHISETIHHNCYICGDTPCTKFNRFGQPLCSSCVNPKDPQNLIHTKNTPSSHHL